jgi:signal transduction histidine kinase
VVITHDISTYQKLEKQKDDFIAIASHELKTPVTTIKAFAQILRKKWSEASDAESKHFLQKMDLQVDKLTVLIRQLLDVGKLQSGELKIHKQMFNLDSLIENIIDDFQQTTETHTIIKDGKLGTKIRADKNLITQVLNNLISNAIKYSPEAKKVIVKVKKQPNEVLIGVQDFGIGIPKESREKIFDRFFRINDTNGQRFPGLGLGLYISKEIISKHNGRVWVESNGSKGSTFFFTLPVKVK